MQIESATETDFPEIIGVWERSVRATHDFLSEEDIQFFKPLILNEYLKAVDLFVVREDEKILGFLGLFQTSIKFLAEALRFLTSASLRPIARSSRRVGRR